MSFKEIEEVIGAPLPPSAFKHRAWWSNKPGNSVMTGAWLAAGYLSSDVDMAGRKLTFRRTQSNAHGSSRDALPPGDAASPGSSVSSAQREQTPASATATLTISDIDADAKRWLAARSDVAGTTIEQVARDILKEHARPSLNERLTFADQLRKIGPDLSAVDVPALIREDRDAR
jgi:hypothetical protein